jgi:hypothetical protein
MPLYFYAALGAIASSAFSGGDAAAKQHIITPASPKTVQQLPPLTIIEQALASEDYKWASNVLDQLSISGEGTDIVRLTTQWIGSGRRIRPSVFTPSTQGEVDSARVFVYNTQAQITVADAGTLANSSQAGCALRSWGVNISNNHNADEGYLPACSKFQDSANKQLGIYRARCLRGALVIAPSFVVEVEVGSPWVAAFENQSPIDWSVAMSGPAIAGTTKSHSGILHGFLTKYSALAKQRAGNLLRYAINPKILRDSSGNSFDATFINTQASYTS